MTRVLDQTCQHGTWSPFGQRGDDRFVLSIPPGEVFDSCVLTITGKRLNAGAALSAQPASGQTGSGTATVHWWYDGGGEIDYRLEAFSRAHGGAPGISVRVPHFLPSTAGFEFANSFPHRPDLILPTPFGDLEVGDATNGLCGGMVHAVRDWFEAAAPVPQGTTPPDSGPLFDYLVQRLFDSFDLPDGVRRYLELMAPALPDHETDMSRLQLAPHGRSWRMVVEEWPRIKADLDGGALCTLGLVLVKSADPTQLGRNHQVLAWGYDLDGTRLALRIYDPNRPLDDGVTLCLDVGDAEHTREVTLAGAPVVSFFRDRYQRHVPPGVTGHAPIRVVLRALANGRMVSGNEGGRPLLADAAALSGSGLFELVIAGSNRVALRSVATGRYVCAENAGAAPLSASRAVLGPWETFELCWAPGNHVALRALANHKYVCADGGGKLPLVANRDQVGPWETFTLVAV